MCDISKRKAYVVYALRKLGPLTPAQIGRYLFENGICGEFDLRQVLTCLKEEDVAKQAVSIQGITYELTDECGRRAAELEELLTPGEREGMDEAGEELRRCFRMEKDYLARYSEQATGIIPLFLSLREKEKILFKVNVIVPDVRTAEKIAKKWPENAQKTYRAIWDCIGEGEPFPDFTGIWGEEEDEEA